MLFFILVGNSHSGADYWVQVVGYSYMRHVKLMENIPAVLEFSCHLMLSLIMNIHRIQQKLWWDAKVDSSRGIFLFEAVPIDTSQHKYLVWLTWCERFKAFGPRKPGKHVCFFCNFSFSTNISSWIVLQSLKCQRQIPLCYSKNHKNSSSRNYFLSSRPVLGIAMQLRVGLPDGSVSTLQVEQDATVDQLKEKVCFLFVVFLCAKVTWP